MNMHEIHSSPQQNEEKDAHEIYHVSFHNHDNSNNNSNNNRQEVDYECDFTSYENTNINLEEETLPAINKIKFNKKIKFVKNGMTHFLIVTKDNEIYAYGRNYFGQLGTGNDDSIEHEITKVEAIEKLNIGNIKSLDCSYSFSIILNDKNEMFGAGFNCFGLNDRIRKVNIFTKIETDINEKIKIITCGYNYFFFVTQNNNIYGIGNNDLGQLGLNKNMNRLIKFTKINYLKNINVKDIQCGYSHSILLDYNGIIYGTGNNQFGQLGLGYNGNVYEFTKINLSFKVKKVVCNFLGVILINEFNELFGTGHNESGLLGLGDFNDRNIFTKIIIDNNDIKVKNIFKSLGINNILCTMDNELYGSGNTTYGQLGIDKQCCKLDGMNQSYSNEYNYNRFTKINYVKTDLRFIHLLIFPTEYFMFATNYKINEVNDNDSFQLQCLQKARDNLLTDITIVQESNCFIPEKKRKLK
ncbi:hypothetical protein ABK040_001100 [Willaertia magna]